MAEASIWGSTEMDEGSYIGGAGFKREGILRAGGSMHTQQYFESLSSKDNDEGGRWISKKIIDSQTIKYHTLRIAMIGLLCTVVKLEIFLQIRSGFGLEICTPHQSSSSRVAAPVSNGASSFTDHRRYAGKKVHCSRR